MKQKLLSIFSFLLFLALLIPFAYSSSRLLLFEGLFALGFYSPLVLAVIGFAAAWFGVRTVYRMLLTSGHVFLFVLYAFLLFVAKFGFQEP
ncbi:hypothetical protein ON064_11770 [Planococcus sp. A6]|uniref:hypothetical protein n=1 Tax=Planococcus sp. A6 TaxID=2992760 RepID=UPI00237C32B5|nr:hypothetical protein [Planococcus sp. A6]MDE0583710.1 hypothetical protein [Planococcus sp. A6]